MRKVLFALICRYLHCLFRFYNHRGIVEWQGNFFWKKYKFIGCSCGKTFYGEASQLVKDLGWID